MDFEASKMEKLEDISYEMLVLVLPPVASRVSSFPLPRRVYGGRCKIYRFIILPTIKIKGNQSRTKCLFFCIHASWLESLNFLCHLYVGSYKTSPF